MNVSKELFGFLIMAVLATTAKAQFLSSLDSLPEDKVCTVVDSTGLQVRIGASRTKINPYGICITPDSMLAGHYPLIVNPPKNHPDAVPFLFNMNSTPQLPYTGNNNVMMFGWNIGNGGSNFIPGRAGIGYSMESNFHPGGDPNTTWVESHEFYLKPNGTQVRLKSYTIGVPPAAEFIDLYHTIDNFHLRNDDLFDYFTVTRNKNNGQAIMNFSSNGEVNMVIGRTDYAQSLQFQLTPDRINIIGQSKIIALPGTKELYIDADNVGGINTGYGLNLGSGICAMGEMGIRQVQYSFYTNNTFDRQDDIILAIGSYSGSFSGKHNSLVAYNNGTITIHKNWMQQSGTASLEVGKKSGAKTPLKLDDLPMYESNAKAIAEGLEPGCLYIREGHGLDVVVAVQGSNTRSAAADITSIKK